MKIIISIATLILALNLQISAQEETQSYEEVLKELMSITGSEETFTTVVKQMIDIFKREQNNQVPEKFWDEMEKEMTETGIEDLTVLLIPVYQKHLTIEDLYGIIEFYNSPVGKKYAEKTPFITQESMAIGQTWGAEIGARIAQKLIDEGY